MFFFFVFSAAGRFDIFCFPPKQIVARIGPEVTVGCLGVVSTHYPFGAFSDHFGPKSEKRPKNENCNSYASFIRYDRTHRLRLVGEVAASLPIYAYIQDVALCDVMLCCSAHQFRVEL